VGVPLALPVDAARCSGFGDPYAAGDDDAPVSYGYNSDAAVAAGCC
jgi:hypothetical protein